MLHARLAPRDLKVGLRQLLPVIDALHQRIMRALGYAALQQVQQHLRVFGIVLIPGVV